MENLNKENLFNDLYNLYSDAMKLFCDWIDKYKKEKELEERCATCTCGAWQLTKSGEVVHVADCCCSAE